MPLLDEDYLILSTIHSAKGQEWKSVYLLNVVDGCMPSDLGAGTSAELEEERRLLYVAMIQGELSAAFSSNHVRALPSPIPAAKHTPFRWAALLLLEPFTLVTEALDLDQHPLQQKFGRRSRDAGALELEDLLTLSSELDAHVLDFGADVVQTHSAPHYPLDCADEPFRPAL